jgi:hypothetical protein
VSHGTDRGTQACCFGIHYEPRASKPFSTDLVFAESDKDFSVTGLRVSSALQLHRMMTVATNIIVRELGTLPKSAQKEVEGKLKLLFGIK